MINIAVLIGFICGALAAHSGLKAKFRKLKDDIHRLEVKSFKKGYAHGVSAVALPGFDYDSLSGVIKQPTTVIVGEWENGQD